MLHFVMFVVYFVRVDSVASISSHYIIAEFGHIKLKKVYSEIVGCDDGWWLTLYSLTAKWELYIQTIIHNPSIFPCLLASEQKSVRD